MVTHSHPALRAILLGLGVLLMLVSPITAPLPGPGATLLFAAGLALVLRNSLWARRRWARLVRHRPRVRGVVDWGMRRPSARRRRERDRAGSVD